MGHRLGIIATRTGDDGSTGLADGSRLGKDSARVQSLGDMDELNSFLGLLACETLPPGMTDEILAIQNDLFDLGGELSLPSQTLLAEARVAWLDQSLTRHNTGLPPLREFILPGGSRAAALAHVARAVCRRTERGLIALAASEPVSMNARRYLNRLSDLLFVLARVCNREAGTANIQEPHWRKPSPA